MTMEWSSGLNWSWHRQMCSQVRLDVCYMEEAFVFCYNTDNAAKKNLVNTGSVKVYQSGC